MSNRNIKVVADSSSGIYSFDGLKYSAAPLKIVTNDKEYVDDEHLDVEGMVEDLRHYKGKSTTSCPSVGDWIDAFENADEVFCITISNTLSGSFNSATTAKKHYEQDFPGRKVFVIDSLSTGPEMLMIIEKLREYADKDLPFEEMCEKIVAFQKRVGLVFMLESLRNLANNGRVNPTVAKIASVLGIRIVGKASDDGVLTLLDKCRGETKGLEMMVKHMKELGFRSGRVYITHCMNLPTAEKLKGMVENAFEKAQVTISKMGGLCSFYAEKGGLIVSFDR